MFYYLQQVDQILHNNRVKWEKNVLWFTRQNPWRMNAHWRTNNSLHLIKGPVNFAGFFLQFVLGFKMCKITMHDSSFFLTVAIYFSKSVIQFVKKLVGIIWTATHLWKGKGDTHETCFRDATSCFSVLILKVWEPLIHGSLTAIVSLQSLR